MKDDFSYILDQSGITLLPPPDTNPSDMMPSVLINEDDESQHLVVHETEVVIPSSEEVILSCRLCNTEFHSEDDSRGHMDAHPYLAYLNDCVIDAESMYGWVEDEYTLQSFIDDFTGSTGVSFVTRTSGRNKGRKRKGKVKGGGGDDIEEEGDERCSDRIMFHFKSSVLPIPELPFPFTCANYTTKECLHGRRYQTWEDKVLKKAERETLLPLEHADYARPNVLIQNRSENRCIKKVACEATMYIKEITVYPQYTLECEGAAKAYHIRKAKTMAMEQLKRDIALGVEVERKPRFYLKVPLVAAHNHVTGNIVVDESDDTTEEDLHDDAGESILTEEEGSLQDEESRDIVEEDTSSVIIDGEADGTNEEILTEITMEETVTGLRQEVLNQLEDLKTLLSSCSDIMALHGCLESITDMKRRYVETSLVSSISEIKYGNCTLR